MEGTGSRVSTTKGYQRYCTMAATARTCRIRRVLRGLLAQSMMGLSKAVLLSRFKGELELERDYTSEGKAMPSQESKTSKGIKKGGFATQQSGIS